MIETTAIPTAPRAPRRSVWRRVLRGPGFWLPALVLTLLALIALWPELFAGLFGNGDPRACDLSDSGLPPSAGHPFGLDLQGCDAYANVIFGARSSLSVGVLATILGSIIAITFGTLAGLYGGVIDWIITRLTDIFLGFPFLLGAVVVLTSVGERTVLTVSLVLAMFGWPLMARVMRGAVRSVSRRDYVLAARTMGVGELRIILRYVLPNAIQPVIVLATLAVGSIIVAESSLTYLGIGLERPAISWGLQLAAASGQFAQAPHLLVFPSIFLVITVLSIITLGDTLRLALDPRRAR
ncbi:MAG: ABC transporter permease [Microbacteriaceae bacterium]